MSCSNNIPDLDLSSFAIEYREACLDSTLWDLAPSVCIQTLVKSGSREVYCTLITALARIVAAKPYSADVERLIKSYNVLKTDERSNLSSETLMNYLYIRHNMPVVAEFDARPAVLNCLKDKERRTVETKKHKEQRRFSTMFSEALTVTRNSKSNTDIADRALGGTDQSPDVRLIAP